jgi:hypothetical protein
MERDEIPAEQSVADAIRRLKAAAVVPPVDPAREAVLLAAFDAAHREGAVVPVKRRDQWFLAAFAAAAVIVIAVGIEFRRSGPIGQHGGAGTASGVLPAREIRLAPPNDFVIVPTAVGLPPMESGTLVRVNLPVAELPSLGVAPPAGPAATVTADLIVAQDGLPRAVRVVVP